jgi:hypothetical protein
MVKTESSSSLNGKLLLQGGNKKTNSLNFQLHSQPTNEKLILFDKGIFYLLKILFN